MRKSLLLFGLLLLSCYVGGNATISVQENAVAGAESAPTNVTNVVPKQAVSSVVRDNTAFRLIRNASELEVGVEYVIVATSANTAVSNVEVLTSKLKGTPVTVEEGVLYPTDATMIFTLENGSLEGEYRLRANNYAGNSADNNFLIIGDETNVRIEQVDNDVDGRVQLLFTDAEGDVRIFVREESYLQFYKTESVFSNYIPSAEYVSVQLYKNEHEHAKTPMPVIAVNKQEAIEGENVEVTISNIAEGATVRYTTDGTVPSATSGVVYNNEPFMLENLSGDVEVKAIAFKDGFAPSQVASVTVKVILKPRMPLVEWVVDGVAYSAENGGEYEVRAGKEVTLSAVNGDKIRVIYGGEEKEFDSPYSMILQEDMNAKFASVNSAYSLVSDAMSVQFKVNKNLPGVPQVSYAISGTTYLAEFDKPNYVYENTKVTVESSDADQIEVSVDGQTASYPLPYSFFVKKDADYTLVGVNSYGRSMKVNVQFRAVKNSADITYTLVNDATGIEANALYIIADSGTKMAVSNSAVEGALGSVKATFNGQNLVSAGNMMIFKLEEGAEQGTYLFRSNNYDGTVLNHYLTPIGNDAGIVHMSDVPMALSVSFINGTPDVKIQSQDGDAEYLRYDGDAALFRYLPADAGGSSNVQLYKVKATGNVVQPGLPTVTFTRDEGSEPEALGNGEEGTATNSSTITITSTNATSIIVNYEEHLVPDGVYTFTIDRDKDCYSVWAVSGAGVTEEISFRVNVDYTAATIAEALEKSLRQKNRNDVNENASVLFTGWTFITGHYLSHDRYELVWIEDSEGNGNVLYDEQGALERTNASLERGTMMRNFVVQSRNYLHYNYALHLMSWPDADDVQTCAFPEIPIQGNIGLENLFRCVKVQGNASFSDVGAIVTLTSGAQISVNNVLRYPEGVNVTPPTDLPENVFSWLPGQPWPSGEVREAVYVVGFVMPTDNGYTLYAAQATNDEGQITGVDEVEDNAEALVEVKDGIISAPKDSRIFSLCGMPIRIGEPVAPGVYVVRLPDGRVVKVAVR